MQQGISRSSSRRQRGGTAGLLPSRGGGGVPSAAGGKPRNGGVGGGGGGGSSSSSFVTNKHQPKWFPSWRRLRKCLLPPSILWSPPSRTGGASGRRSGGGEGPSSMPSQAAGPPRPDDDAPSDPHSFCGSDATSSQHEEQDPPNLSSPLSLASSSSTTSTPPPPPPPLSLSSLHRDDDRSSPKAFSPLLVHPLAASVVEELEGKHAVVGSPCGATNGGVNESTLVVVTEPRRVPGAVGSDDSDSSTEQETDAETSIEEPPPAMVALALMKDVVADDEHVVHDDNVTDACPAATAAAKPGPVRRTCTEAPAMKSRVVGAAAIVSHPNAKALAPTQEIVTDQAPSAMGQPGTIVSEAFRGTAAASLAERPAMVRRGCTVPLPLPPAKQQLQHPLSPTGARAMLLPPKAPAPPSGSGGGGRPSLVSRRISSTATGISAGGGAAAGHRPRLGSSGCESNHTSSSRHRRNNNSFEFSVDSLRMIRDDNPAANPGRQMSDNSWSTMPMSSIRIGSLERDCSELVSDDFWEVDSLIMSSDDGEDDEDVKEDGHANEDPVGNFGDEEEADDNDSTAGNDKSTSPSPTSVMDDVDGRSKSREGVDGLPDWMLQWADQQPSSPNRLKNGDDDEEAAEVDAVAPPAAEPTYLPPGPRPEGCLFSAYLSVSTGDQDPLDGDSSVRLVQVVYKKLVVEGKWEMALSRETRVLPVFQEHDPRRSVLVRLQSQEWKLCPVALVATKNGTFRLASPSPLVAGGVVVNDGDAMDESSHYEADCSVACPVHADDDSQQCEAVLHLVFLLDALCRQKQAP